MTLLVVAACQLLLAGALTFHAIISWRALRGLQRGFTETMKAILFLEHRLAIYTKRPDLFHYRPEAFGAAPNPPEQKPTVN